MAAIQYLCCLAGPTFAPYIDTIIKVVNDDNVDDDDNHHNDISKIHPVTRNNSKC